MIKSPPSAANDLLVMMTSIPAITPAGYMATSTIGLLLLISLRAQFASTSAQIILNNCRVMTSNSRTKPQCRFGARGTSCKGVSGGVSPEGVVEGMLPSTCDTGAPSVLPSLLVK